MKNKSYSEKLKDPRWQKRRLFIFERDQWACQCCGDKETSLNVHHKKYVGDPWESPEDQLVTLCEDCHEIISIQKLDMNAGLVEVRKIQRPSHMTYFCLSVEGVMLFMRSPGKPIECFGGASHDIMKHIIHDTINYWLKTDQDHYLTEKLIPENG